MSDSRTRILEMLAQKKISVDEAEKLLTAIGTDEKPAMSVPTGIPSENRIPKYLRVVVEPGPNSDKGTGTEKVNIKVPISLIRAGMKLTSLIPPQASNKMSEAMKEKGIDFDLKNIKPEDMDEIIEALRDLEVNVDGGEETVRVYAE